MNTPEDTLDLMRDEFLRIIACPGATDEIKGKCVRAISEILVRVPIIQERDRLEKELRETKSKLEYSQARIAAITENKGDDSVTDLEKLVRQSLLDWIGSGMGDECFWEHWDECPTEISLTPSMVWLFLEAEISRLQRQVNSARAKLSEVTATTTAEGAIKAMQTWMDVDSLAAKEAKLSERKTIHEWLNQIGAEDTEPNGKPMCLLRRLAVHLGIQPYST